MAILGEADAELEDLLGRDRDDPARRFQADQGRCHGRRDLRGREGLVAKSKQHNNMEFLAHGMGLVRPRGAAPDQYRSGAYTDEDAHRPLEAGSVISVETTLKHPTRGSSSSRTPLR